ncbi:hypothetical protein DOM21_12880 [Bacteriovorax stolpii]|uniref:metallophosphoesterase n=1 Tax=Bacteriovorax stolpii TaxID=960 RepID=UPI00115A1993|nr:metallophosphoesterase [Bacteriovorax stolpii]QDK42321.1 hypothetical protein DOM21_12880 [Bacteriovorax stolpii]
MLRKNLVFILALLSVMMLGYSYFIETNWLDITRHRINLKTNSNKKLKIIQISDLHTNGIGSIEEKVIRAIQSEKPDFIFLTGDIATPGGTNSGYEKVLKELKAKQAIYYIPGNWEDWEPISDLSNILKRNNIIDLTNKTLRLDKNLWLTGFADAPTGNPDLRILKNIPNDSKIISIFHSPIFFDEVSNSTDLAFAGHTHGGQIRLPLIGSIALPPGSGKYDQGWFQKNRAKMYVNRGIGTSIVPFRFLCRPEISIFEISY